MTYARIENGNVVEYPIYEGEIKLRYPNTSFPIPFLAPPEYREVIDTPRPAADHTKNVVEGALVKSGDTWKRTWDVVDASSEEIATRTDGEALNVRINRNQRLAASDWTQLIDSPLDADAKLAWQLYRETLRMVPQQTGFPWNVEWPPEPGTN